MLSLWLCRLGVTEHVPAVWPWLVLWRPWSQAAPCSMWPWLCVLWGCQRVRTCGWNNRRTMSSWWLLPTWWVIMRIISSYCWYALTLYSVFSMFKMFVPYVMMILSTACRLMVCPALSHGDLQQCVWCCEQLWVFWLWRGLLLCLCGWRSAYRALLGRLLLHWGCQDSTPKHLRAW